MNEYIFSDYLHEYVDLSPNQLDLLLAHSRTIALKRGEHILRPGQLCRHRFFVERGAVREYSLSNDGKEHNLHFAIEGWFVISVEAIFFSRPSSYFVEAVEPTRLLLIAEDRVEALMRQEEAFERWNRQLLYEHIQTLQHRITTLQSDSAEERYLHFVKTYPAIAMRLPQAMIASYLGITPESLSRIRKQLATRHRA